MYYLLGPLGPKHGANQQVSQVPKPQIANHLIFLLFVLFQPSSVPFSCRHGFAYRGGQKETSNFRAPKHQITWSAEVLQFCRFSPHTFHLERKIEVFPAERIKRSEDQTTVGWPLFSAVLAQSHVCRKRDQLIVTQPTGFRALNFWKFTRGCKILWLTPRDSK